MSFNSNIVDCTFKKHRKSGDTVYALTQISSNRIMVKKLPVTHPPLVLQPGADPGGGARGPGPPPDPRF